MKFRAGDYLIFLIILSASIFFILKVKLGMGNKFSVSANGIEYEYSLNQDKTYEIKGRIGITKIQVENGRVRIIDSPCKNKTCVHQGWAKNIICLPNDVIVTVLNEDDFDAIAQ